MHSDQVWDDLFADMRLQTCCAAATEPYVSYDTQAFLCLYKLPYA
jgi:hypothetical protein